MASMLEYLQEMERRKAMGMTPGVPYASKYPSTSTYAPFQNLKKDLGYYKSNVGNIAASSNPATTAIFIKLLHPVEGIGCITQFSNPTVKISLGATYASKIKS